MEKEAKKQTESNTALAKRVELENQRMISLCDLINEKISLIEEEFRNMVSPVDIDIVPRPSTPSEQLFDAPQLQPPDTVWSKATSKLKEAQSQQLIKAEQLDRGGEYASKERERRNQALQDKLRGKFVVQVPVSDIVRGIMDRGTSNRNGQYAAQSSPIPKSRVGIPTQLTIITINFETYGPFKNISDRLKKLEALQKTHFNSLDRDGSVTPIDLSPDFLRIFLSWAPTAKIRRFQITAFYERVLKSAEIKKILLELDQLLNKRIREIESYPPASVIGPEGGGSIRA